MKTYDFLHVIAHPDDDAIFGAKYQWHNRSANWGVVCFTQDASTVRGKELLAFQARMGVKPSDIYFLGFEDNPADKIRGVCSFSYLDARGKLLSLGVSAKTILTHNPTGEYGHPQHRMTSFVTMANFVGSNIVCYAWGARDADITIQGISFYKWACECYPTQKGVLDLWQRRARIFNVGKYIREMNAGSVMLDTD